MRPAWAVESGGGVATAPPHAEADPEAIVADIIDPDRRGEIYPLYRRLRQVAPVHRTASPVFHGGWILTRYADGNAVLRSGKAITDATSLEIIAGGIGGAWFDLMARTMLFADPVSHQRLRRLVVRAFSREMVEQLRPRTQQIVDELLDAVAGAGRMELVSQFAYPLPLNVVAAMLGVPTSDLPLIQRWTFGFARRTDLAHPTPDVVARGEEATLGFEEYFRGLAAARRKNPEDDLLSALVAVEDEGERLSEPEIVAMCVLLLQAGHETTADMIGNAMVALFQNPDQLELLAREPALTESAVEELLRYCSGVHFSFRVLTDDLVLGQRTLDAGDTVVVALGAVNRDPDRFDDPERLDLRRPDNAHLAFGFGSHLCVGAALARMETQVALRSLLDRAPGIRPEDAAPAWRPTLVLRGLEHLHVRWD